MIKSVSQPFMYISPQTNLQTRDSNPFLQFNVFPTRPAVIYVCAGSQVMVVFRD